VSAFYLGIIAAGAMAWAAGTASLYGLDEAVAAAAIPLRRVKTYRLGASIVILTIPYLVGHVVAFALTARTFPPGMALWAGYALLGYAALLLAMAWGWLFGMLFGATYGALAALVSWALIVAYLSKYSDLTVVSGPVWERVNISALVVRCVAVSALLLAVLWYPAKTSSLKARWLGATTSVTTGLIALAAVGTIPGVGLRHPTATPICVDGRIIMCVWPESKKYIPMIRSFNRRVDELPPVLVLPARLNQYGIDQERVHYDGETRTQPAGGFDITEGSRWGLAFGLSNSIMETTLARCDRRMMMREKDYSAEAVRRWTEFFLAQGDSPDYKTRGASPEIDGAWSTAKDVLALPAIEQSAWVQKQILGLRSKYCA
jgi:hypothetical protein